jgi:hypothetical protein
MRDMTLRHAARSSDRLPNSSLFRFSGLGFVDCLLMGDGGSGMGNGNWEFVYRLRTEDNPSLCRQACLSFYPPKGVTLGGHPRGAI